MINKKYPMDAAYARIARIPRKKEKKAVGTKWAANALFLAVVGIPFIYFATMLIFSLSAWLFMLAKL